MRAFFISFGVLAGLGLAGAAFFIYSGVYNIAADDPHWDITARLLEQLRVRSLERRAQQVTAVPNLEDEQLITKGAGQYSAMCVSCHLAPGVAPNELSKGLYPAPPQLTRNRLDPRVSYTIIKHGIKMSGMPAWGGHHGDQQVWSLVAFVAKLPGMSPEKYQEYVRSPAAGAAAAMASHGAMMQQMPASSAGHGPPGHHDMPGMGASRPTTAGQAASEPRGAPGHHEASEGEPRR